MLNQYTLNFLYSEQQLKYMEWNSPKIIKEHLHSTVYLLVSKLNLLESFALISMVQFILDYNISYIVVCGICCIVVLYLHKYITRQPHKIDYVITFYQIFALVVMEVDTFLPYSEKIRSNFAWSYGYQTCFIHFCLYLQGTNFICSTIVLFMVNSTHVSLFSYYPSYSIPIIVSFFFMFICMTAVKYNYEKKKKEEFFNYTQLEQWEMIIQKSISNAMILIQFDKAQDQLRLIKQSIKSQQMHSIHDCQTLRSFLRNLIEVKSKQKFKSLDLSNNLERYIRRQLLSYSESQKIQNQIYVDHMSKIIYEVKFSKFILNNELQGLVILDKIEVSNNDYLNTQLYLFNDISIKMGLLIKHQLYQIMTQNLKSCKNMFTTQIREVYNLQSTIFYFQHLLHKKPLIIKEQITHSQLFFYIQQIFGDKCHLICTKPFLLQYSYIISILITCSKLVEYTQGSLPQFRVEFKSSDETKMFICYNFPTPQYNQKIYQLLMTHKISYNSKSFDQDTVYDNCISHLCNLKQQYNLPLLLLFDICAMQILLSQICQYNYLHVEQNPLILELQCTFYNLK